MTIHFEKTNPLVLPEAISSFEKQFALILPYDYKKFLLETNGGKLKDGQVVEYQDRRLGKTNVAIEQFFGIATPSVDLHTKDLFSINSKLKSEDLDILPPELIAIASVFGGHFLIVLSTSNSSFGQIYLWLDSLPSYKFAHLLADNFNDFVHQLTPPLS